MSTLGSPIDGQTDSRLVLRALGGDQGAFEDLVRRYQPLVDSYTRHLLDDAPAAEDVSQEAFMKAYQELSLLREPAQFGPWLKSIAWRECRAWVRRQQSARAALQQLRERASLASGDPDDVLLEDLADEDPWLNRLCAAIEDMSEGNRAVVSLFYLSDLPHEDIARFLGIPIGTVKRRLFDARNAMAETVADAPPMVAAERDRFVASVKVLLGRIQPIRPPGNPPQGSVP